MSSGSTYGIGHRLGRTGTPGSASSRVGFFKSGPKRPRYIGRAVQNIGVDRSFGCHRIHPDGKAGQAPGAKSLDVVARQPVSPKAYPASSGTSIDTSGCSSTTWKAALEPITMTDAPGLQIVLRLAMNQIEARRAGPHRPRRRRLGAGQPCGEGRADAGIGDDDIQVPQFGDALVESPSTARSGSRTRRQSRVNARLPLLLDQVAAGLVQVPRAGPAGTHWSPMSGAHKSTAMMVPRLRPPASVHANVPAPRAAAADPRPTLPGLPLPIARPSFRVYSGVPQWGPTKSLAGMGRLRHGRFG